MTIFRHLASVLFQDLLNCILQEIPTIFNILVTHIHLNKNGENLNNEIFICLPQYFSTKARRVKNNVRNSKWREANQLASMESLFFTPS